MSMLVFTVAALSGRLGKDNRASFRIARFFFDTEQTSKPFALSLSKGRPFLRRRKKRTVLRQAQHERG
jgi:hypothetical protein